MAQEDDALRVPSAALRFVPPAKGGRATGDTVWTVDDKGKVRPHKVKPGQSDGTLTALLESDLKRAGGRRRHRPAGRARPAARSRSEAVPNPRATPFRSSRPVGLTRIYDVGGQTVTALIDVDLTIDARRVRRRSWARRAPANPPCMNLLGCLDRPTPGSYRLGGEDVGRPRRRRAGRDAQPRASASCFQSFNLLPRTRRARERRAAADLRRRAGRERDAARARSAGRASGWPTALHHRPTQLSGGQQQRVAIARALVNRARRSCLPTSRPAPSTPAPATRSWRCSSALNASRHHRRPGHPRARHRGHARRIVRLATAAIASDEPYRAASACRGATVAGDGSRMSYLDAVRSALDALRANPTRSILTMLGIIIGVARGDHRRRHRLRRARRSSSRRSRASGSNLLDHRAGHRDRGRGARIASAAAALTEDDAEALARRAAGRRSTSVPDRQGRRRSWCAAASNWSTARLRRRRRLPGGARLGARPRARLRRRTSSRPARRWRCSAQTVARRAVRRRATAVGPDGPRPGRAASTVVGVLTPQGPDHARARTRTTRSWCRCTTAKRAAARPRRRQPGAVDRSWSRSTTATTCTRRRPTSRDLLRARHHRRPRQDDDFSVENLADVLQIKDALDARPSRRCVGGDRVGLAAGRRHRDHEHHAGLGDRAHARDRHPHGGGRPAGATSWRSS